MTQGQRFREQLGGRSLQFQQQQAPLNRLQSLALGGQRLAGSIGGQQIGQGQTLAEIQAQLGNVNAAREIAQGNVFRDVVKTGIEVAPLFTGG